MNLTLIAGLAVACAVLMFFERRGLKTTLSLNMKGDVKRETRWLAQYGQSVCTGVAALLVFQLDPRPHRGKLALVAIIAVAAASVVAMANRVMPWSTRASAMASDQPAISA